jgi:hypothetical protein
VDGVDLVIDGVPSGRMFPRWIDQLTGLGFVPDDDGPVTFEVLIDGLIQDRADDVREALYLALVCTAAGFHPDRIRVDARTAVGLRVEVVSGYQTIGMAIGALEDPPITVIESPSVLPEYAPGERRAKRKRSRPGASSRG